MPLHRNPAERFDANLRIVTRAGIEPPPEIAALRERLEDFRQSAFTSSALDRVVDAVVGGTDEPMPVLWSAACAEFTITDPRKNDLLNLVRLRVNTAIREKYAPVAIANYELIAARFNEAAQGFSAAAAVCDPTTSADIVVAAPDKMRKAWQASATHADELSTLLPVLKAAAELAGICGADEDDAIRLAVDGTGIDRDVLIDAWLTERRESLEATKHRNNDPFTRQTPTQTRGGRWTALLTAGAIIRALPVSELELAGTVGTA